LDDVEAQYRVWRRTGPPLNIAAVAIARSLGVDLVRSESTPESKPHDLAPDRPTLAGLAKDVAMPIAGGDTQAASRAILMKLKEMT